jgi:hypothetical protein
MNRDWLRRQIDAAVSEITGMPSNDWTAEILTQRILDRLLVNVNVKVNIRPEFQELNLEVIILPTPLTTPARMGTKKA